MRWSRLSLRSKVTIVSAAAAAAVLTAGALLLYAGMSSSLSAAVSEELRIRAFDVGAESQLQEPLILGGGFPAQIIAEDGTVLEPDGEPLLLTQDEFEAAKKGEIVVDRPVEGVGENTRVLARPVESGSNDAAVVAVVGSTGPILNARKRLGLVLGIAGPTMILAVAATAWLVSGAALRPVRRMSRRARSLSLESSSERLPQPPGQDEIAELGRTLNHMLERISSTIAHERTFVDNASHELRSPVAVLRGELELALVELEREPDHQAIRAALESSLEEADRLTRLTDHLLVLARADARTLAERREPLDLREVVEAVVGRYSRQATEVEAALAPAVVSGDRVNLEQAVVNLLDNACRWARSRVRVELSTTDGDAVLVVADDGPGFSAEVGEQALDRFTRGDDSRGRGGGGAGLGLSIVAAVASAHDGQVQVANGEPLGGAQVTVRLPLADT